MKINNVNITKKSFWIGFISFQTLFACSGQNQQMEQSRGTIQLKPSTSKEAQQEIKHHNAQTTFGVVLLHGLGMDTSEMEPLEEALSKRYDEAGILVIKPKSREGNHSIKKSIKEQTEIVYNEIVTELEERHHKDASTFPLYILGQSQGGVIALFIAKEYKNELNMYGFITNDAPLKGVDYLRRGPLETAAFANNARSGLQVIGTEPHSQISIQEGIIRITLYYLSRLLELIHLKNWNPVSGVRDVLPGSPCMELVSHYLRNHGVDEVPGILIGGFENDISNLYHNTIEEYKKQHKDDQEVDQIMNAFNQEIARFITGDPNGLHDYVVPLKSQLCRGDSLEDLTHIGQDPYPVGIPDNPKINSYVIRNITHCDDAFPITNKKIEREESMMKPNRMLPIVYKFIDDINEKNGIANIP